MNFSNIEIKDNPSTAEFLRYVWIIICSYKWSWITWIFLMRTFGRNRCRWFVFKAGQEVIGGCSIADYPVAKYKPFNLFDPAARAKIDELRAAGYLGGCCLIVSKKWRNSGFGTYLLEHWLGKLPVNLYFTATKKAVPLYLRHGAKIVYPARYTIYTFENR